MSERKEQFKDNREIQVMITRQEECDSIVKTVGIGQLSLVLQEQDLYQQEMDNNSRLQEKYEGL